MKARILALAALVLGVVSCQTEPEGLDVNVGGDGVTTISVVLPEDAISRATAADETNSAWSGLQNTKGEKLRVILQVFDENGNTNASETLRQVQELEEGVLTAYFDVRLVPNRKYTFVAWADQGADYFDATDLKNVKIVEGSWTAMNEYRDAFTATHTEASFSSASNITLKLTRPFAKLRVVTTDMEQLGHLDINPAKAAVSYNVELPNAFNAFAGTVGTTTETKEFGTFEINAYTEDAANSKTLFTDYVFVPADGVVKFNLEAKESDGRRIKLNQFTTDIPVKRNNLTTIAGNILTEGSNVTVTVDPVFENAGSSNPDYEYATISSEAEFFAAVNGNSGQYILISDIDVDGVYASTNAATRANGGKTINIDLNGKTITVNNDSTDALISLAAGDALIFSGEGDIIGSGKLAGDDANVVVTGDVDVVASVTGVKTGIDALKFILANGGEFNFTENLEATEVVWVKTTNPVVINGNNFNLTSSANRIVRIEKSNAVVTFNDVNFISSAVATYLSDARGVSVDPQLSNVALTLNNCSIDFTDKTTNDWTYAVNVSGNGTGHKVTVNGGSYEGANVVNAHGAKNTIVVKNATLTSLYPNNDVYYGACIWVLQNQGSSVYAEGNTFYGSNAIAFNLGTGTALEEKNNIDNTKYVAAKVGNNYYYNVAQAINAAENGATVKVLQDHDCNVAATVATGKTITLDLNECTITGTDSSTGSYALITNKGNLTITGNGKMTLKAENNREWNAYSSVISNTVGGKLVVENGTIEHLGGTDMAYGIDNLTNGKGTYAETVINGGTIKSTYRAVRMFLNGIEAQNLLTVNGGIIEGANKSIWMQDPSKNANTGKLVVKEGAELKGDVYLFVTAGSTSWPVEVSIAASAVKGEVLTGNVPAGYEVVEKDGVWTVVAYTKVNNVDELKAALKDCKPIILGADITVTEKWDNRYTGAKVSKAISIDGNGKTLKFACEVQDNNYVAAFRFEAPAVVKNLTFDMSEVKNKCAAISTKGNIIVDNCTFIGSENYTGCRGIRFGEGAGNAISNVEVAVTNSTFTNFGRGITDNENGQDAKSVTITDNTCTNAHVYVSAHDSIVFTGNTMNSSAANFRTYTYAADATVVATGNTLDTNMADYNIIRGFVAANVNCQEGFRIL